MTRLEIGQWMTNYKHDNSVRFCVGSDGKFPEIHTITYDLQLDAPDKKIFSSLEETCTEAVRLAHQKQPESGLGIQNAFDGLFRSIFHPY